MMKKCVMCGKKFDPVENGIKSNHICRECVEEEQEQDSHA